MIMTNRKLTKTYYFSVEGETEQWYLYWLKDRINESKEATYKVHIDCKIEKDPIKRIKGLTVTQKIEIYHICDYESEDDEHVKQFISIMDKMKKAMSLGTNIKYKFGYSNFTFDLWIALHRIDCFSSQNNRADYLTLINKAFNEKFEKMDDYKKESNFKKCLKNLNISDVKRAIKRSEQIMINNKNFGYVDVTYKGFSYYKENPSLSVFEPIKNMLKDCKLM